MEKLISIIVPVYNVEQYLKECLDSLISQTYKNIEIIIVDDGSTDKSGTICDKYAKKDNRIKVVHKENGGVSSARNTGISIANGEYITFVDSDDYIYKDAIYNLYDSCINSNSDMAIGGVKDFKDGKIVCTSLKKNKILNTEEALKYFFNEKYFKCTVWAKIYKKSLMVNERFDENIKLIEDFEFSYRIMKKVNKVALNTCTYVYAYRIRNNSLMRQKYNKKFENEIDLSEKVLEDVSKIYPSLKNNAIRRYQRVIVSCIDKYFRETEETEGIKYLLEKLKKYPNELDLFQRVKLFMILHCKKILKIIYKNLGKM